jgi:hypothetical protein
MRDLCGLQRLGMHAVTVGKWRRQFLDQRVEGLFYGVCEMRRVVAVRWEMR